MDHENARGAATPDTGTAAPDGTAAGCYCGTINPDEAGACGISGTDT